MPRFFAGLEIPAPPEVVFRCVERPPRPLLPMGAPRLIRLGLTVGEGALYRWEFRRLGLAFRLDCLVETYDPPGWIRFRGLSGWEMEADVRVEPAPGGSRLRFEMRYRFPRPLRWLVPGPLVRLGIWYALRSLRESAELEASA